MIEIHCPSCQTRYRVEERILPSDGPTFKCSRCGHVFRAEPRAPQSPSATTITPFGSGTKAPLEGLPSDSTKSKESAQLKTPAVSTADALKAKQPASKAETPLARSLAESEEPPLGENLSFDFADDDSDELEGEPFSAEPESAERWEVGEPALDDERKSDGPSEIVEPQPSLPRPSSRPGPGDSNRVASRVEHIVSGQAEQGLRSSGFFLALFGLVTIAFAGLSWIISSEPLASRELLVKLPYLAEHFSPRVTAAQLVTLHEVHAEYRRLRQGQPALVLSGRAENMGKVGLHTVQLAVSLLDAGQRELHRQSVWCGNPISPRMIGEMTARELEFFEKLQPPKNFTLKAGETIPFIVVVINPPTEVSRFTIAVVAAGGDGGAGTPPHA